MFQFIETIKVVDGKLFNLDFHQKRLNRTLNYFFNNKYQIDLFQEISLPNLALGTIFKLRIEYSKKINNVSILPYKRKEIKTFQSVESNSIEYSFKFKNREQINILKGNSSADEIIIIKNGFVTDTSYSNIVFTDGYKLITPNTPLLAGTKREFLLKEKLIEEDEIKLSDVKFFKHFYLINSMLELTEENKYSIAQIHD